MGLGRSGCFLKCTCGCVECSGYYRYVVNVVHFYGVETGFVPNWKTAQCYVSLFCKMNVSFLNINVLLLFFQLCFKVLLWGFFFLNKNYIWRNVIIYINK